MSRPVRTIQYSSALAGQTNGQLDANILHTDPDDSKVRLIEPAMRSWIAMTTAHPMTVTSLFDSYRPLRVQQAVFFDRYQLTPTGNESVFYAGQHWYRKTGVATAAVPGTSNHGLAIAADIANVDTHLTWLEAHALDYGWSWEAGIAQSEPWHLHYWAGDTIPFAVLEYERIHGMATTDEVVESWRIKGLFDMDPTLEGTHPRAGDENKLRTAIVGLENGHDELMTLVKGLVEQVHAMAVTLENLDLAAGTFNVTGTLNIAKTGP